MLIRKLGFYLLICCLILASVPTALCRNPESIINDDKSTTSVINTATNIVTDTQSAGYSSGKVAANPTRKTPIALVYRGSVDCDGCSEAVATLLKNDTKWNFTVIYVGPNEKMSVQDGLKLTNAVLYVQPGEDGSVNKAFNKLKKYAPDVRSFVSEGGRYLGVCMGAYMVDNDPGFNLGLNTNQYIKTPRATVKTTADTLVQVAWRGTNRWMYFQDGPYFIPDRGIHGQTILATYMNGKVAAMVQPCGSGKIGVSGPHPEADASWYVDANLTDPDGCDVDLYRDLIDTLMQ